MPRTKFVAEIVVRTPEGTFRHPLAQVGGHKPMMHKDRQTDTRQQKNLRNTVTYADKIKSTPSQHSLQAQHRGSTKSGTENKGKPNKK